MKTVKIATIMFEATLLISVAFGQNTASMPANAQVAGGEMTGLVSDSICKGRNV